MKTVIISYSLTGNNDALAASLAAALPAEHFRIAERRPRSMGRVMRDMAFRLSPSIELPDIDIGEEDLALFVGPVWMSQAASPFRACFKALSPRLHRYAFLSLSGGADGTNPGLAADLARRLGREPVALVDMHIADLLPREPKPTRKDTGAYRINDRDLAYLTGAMSMALRESGAFG
jgi:flavodoxin